MNSNWCPAICTSSYKRQPPVGALIGYCGRIWRVKAVEPLIPGDWSERAREMWLEDRMPDPWVRAPFEVIVTEPDGGPDHGMRIEPWHFLTWHVVPEHYAVCANCGEPAPCAELEGQRYAEQQMKIVEKNLSLPDGCCPACREPITTRQKTHTFPGENLLNPLGAPNVRFHARLKCRGAATDYEEKWVNADSTRQRSLLTLFCEGRVIVHQDGSGECHGVEDCPSIYARHRSISACYCQSHGCGRGCTQTGHPGTRLALNLTPNGAIQP